MSSSNTSYTAKKLARLVAVQTLYQASYEQDDLGTILKTTLEQSNTVLNGDEDAPAIQEKPDAEMLRTITRGVKENQDEIEQIIAGALSERLSSDRMENLLKNILRAGVYELHHHPEIDTGIIISDYVDVAHAFFNGKEPALVNAVLDKLAKKLRG